MEIWTISPDVALILDSSLKPPFPGIIENNVICCCNASPNCRRLFAALQASGGLSSAWTAGSNRVISSEIIEMTTNSSTSVNAGETNRTGRDDRDMAAPIGSQGNNQTLPLGHWTAVAAVSQLTSVASDFGAEFYRTAIPSAKTSVPFGLVRGSRGGSGNRPGDRAAHFGRNWDKADRSATGDASR